MDVVATIEGIFALLLIVQEVGKLDRDDFVMFRNTSYAPLFILENSETFHLKLELCRSLLAQQICVMENVFFPLFASMS